jgi:ComF family protein
VTLRGATRALRVTADALLSITLDPACVACDSPLPSPLDGPVCDDCWTSIRSPTCPLCRVCGVALPTWRTVSIERGCCARCRRIHPAIGVSFAAADYDGSLRRIIHAFKYGGHRSLARRLGDRMRTSGQALLADADATVPVPLHPWRRFRRGFNQAGDLAARLEVPVVHALWRVHATAPQAGLSATARRSNVRDAFRPSPLLSRGALDRHVRGRVVVLVDDVKTTGATLEACAEVLRRAGAREVRALTLARAKLETYA